MRLSRLDLARYGHFTDRSLDFGPARPGEPDLHLVFGRNEAGKSTTLSAVLDMLFGIETRSRYAFLHPYDAMKIGARVELSSGPLELVRLKRNQNSLFDAHERPVPEAVLGEATGGLDRASWQLMVSLDDDTLEKGAEAILGSKGDLGQLLFSASAGLSDLAGRLGEIEGEADAFWRPHGRATRLKEMTARLAELGEARRAADLAAPDHARLVEQHREAVAAHEAAREALTTLRARQARVGALLQALPLARDRAEALAELEPLPEGPEPPEGWHGDIAGLRREALALEVAEADLLKRRQSIADALALLGEADDPTLPADAVSALGQSAARDQTARDDLPRRRVFKAQAEGELAATLARLGRAGEPDPEALVPDIGLAERLRALADARAVLSSRIEVAREEEAEARAEAARLSGAEDTDDRAEAHDALARLLADGRAGEAEARAAEARRVAAQAQRALEDRIEALLPWRGEADDLVALAAPSPDRIQRWRTALEEAAAESRRQRERASEAAGREADLSAALAALETGLGPGSDNSEGAVRAAREAAWADHRRRLDGSSAEVFETALRADDAAMLNRLTRAAELTRLGELKGERALARSRKATADAARETADAAIAGLRETIAAAVTALSPRLDPAMDLAALSAWLDRREAALAARGVWREAVRNAETAAGDAGHLRARLAAALRAVGLEAPDDAGMSDLSALAQRALDRESGRKAAREQRARAEAALARRTALVGRLAEAEQRWQADWREATAAWRLIGPDRDPPGVSALRTLLTDAEALRVPISQLRDLSHRIEAMEHDRATHRANLNALAGPLGLQAVPEGAGEDAFGPLADAVDERLTVLAERRRRRSDMTVARTEAGREGEALARRRAHLDARLRAMGERLGVTGLEAIEQAMEALRRRAEIRRRRDQSERALLSALGVSAIEEAVAAVTGADPAALEQERHRLAGAIEEAEARTSSLFARREALAGELSGIGADGGAAGLEEQRRTHLLHLAEEARQHVRLRAGAMALDQALRLYREHHRSAMMARASAAFATITCGAYKGLASEPADGRERLIAMPAAGGSKPVDTLSKGTRFQLYLALRVAGHGEIAASRGALPFLADDILETFDDERAGATFRVLGETARATQVIYLTHHAHLVDIARAACPGLHLIEL